VEQNLRFFDEVRIFEIGRIFFRENGAIGEKTAVAGALGYKNEGNDKENLFFEIKGVVELMLKNSGIADVWFREPRVVNSGAIKKEAEVMSGNKCLGYLTSSAFELDLAKLIDLAEEDIAYRQISKYPATVRDISLFVPAGTKMVEVLDVIENTAGELLVDTDLFDVYQPEGKPRKSLAFRLIFQSDKKTLTDREVNKLMDKIIKNLERNLEWEVRRQKK
jgi:phenylalanyl-tRNA synthetase beta chain